MEQTVALDVEDQVELARVLIGQGVAAVDSGGVQQDVDVSAALPDIRDHFRDGVAIGEVDAVVVCSAAGRADRIDGIAGGLRAFESG